MAMTPTDAQSTLSAVKQRRHQARNAGMVAGILFFLAAFLAKTVCVAWVMQSPSIAKAGIVTLLTGSAMAASPGIGVLVFRRRMAAPGLVVWLRRFRPGYGDRIRFHRLLGVACFGLANPITIQDSSFKSSWEAASLKSWSFTPLMGLTLFVVSILLGLPLFLAGVNPSPGVAVLWFFASLAIAGRADYHARRRLGFVSRDWSAEQVAKHLDSVRRGRRLLGNGIEVLQVARTGDEWKLVIREALARADLAVIDVSEITGPLTWEIDQALQQLQLDRVLLVAEEGSVRADALHQQLVAAGLTMSTQCWVERALLFYPAARKKGVPAKRAQQIDFKDRLRQELASRLGTPTAA